MVNTSIVGTSVTSHLCSPPVTIENEVTGVNADNQII